MKILYLADIRFPLERANGIQSIETCHALASRGHDVTLIVKPDTHTPPRDPYEFYGLTRIPSLHVEIAPITGPAAAQRAGYLTFTIGRSIGRTRQDVIFTRDLGLASLLLNVPASMRAPMVYEAHTIAADAAAARPQLLTGAEPASAAKLRRLAKRDERVWKHAEGYVTITDGLRAEMQQRFGPRTRVAVVPDGVRAAAADSADEDKGADHAEDADSSMGADYAEHADSQRTSDVGRRTSDLGRRTSDLGPRTSGFTIGYAGHLYPWKGVEAIVEAVAALPDARALIVGGHDKEPDLDRVKAFAEQLNVASRITFTGMIPPADVAARLATADVLVLPNPKSAISSEFTSPLKLFEYMASGRPIVASDLPAIREVLRDAENALLVEPGNAQALAAGIQRIMDDTALGARLAAQARLDVQAFTWAKRAGRLEALFATVTGTAS